MRAAKRSAVAIRVGVNRNLARLSEMVFPLQNQLPPHYFGVPGKGGCLRGEKRRRTLRRLVTGDVTGD